MSVHVVEVAPEGVAVVEVAPGEIEVVQLGTIVNVNQQALPDGVSGQIIVYDATHEPQAVTMTGHATIDADGVMAVTITTSEVSDWTTTFSSAFDDALTERINDSGTETTELFSAAEIISRLASKAATSHSHAASDITSGTLDNARVNWASPSAIGTGTAAAGNFSAVKIGNINLTELSTNLSVDKPIYLAAHGNLLSQESTTISSGGSAKATNLRGNPVNLQTYRSSVSAYVTALRILESSSYVGIGDNLTPQARLHVTETSAATSATITVMRLEASSTGTPAAGFGGSIELRGKSSTAESQIMAYIEAFWNTATHATRAAGLRFSAVNAVGTLTFSEMINDLFAPSVKHYTVHNHAWSMSSSSKDPTSDAPDTWLEVKINGTTYFLPAYEA